MNETTEFLVRHGYLLLFGMVLAEQMGLPLPAIPLLLAAGALSGTGRLNLGVSVGLAVVAALAGDVTWYYIGKIKGGRVLSFLCRISLEPDTCVRKTEETFAKRGAKTLVTAKFVPGLSTIAPPLAGMFGMRLGRFIAYDTLGTLLWVLAYIMTGYIFADQIEAATEYALQFGSWLFAFVLAALAGYLGWKYYQRQRFIAKLRVDRIQPEELKRRLEAGEDVVVVDLRHSMEFEAEPRTIPGALRMTTEEVEARHDEIPRDREIVLYCT